MKDIDIRLLIKKTICKMKSPFSSVNVKISKLMYLDSEVSQLSFSASTYYLVTQNKNIYEIEVIYHPRSFLSSTFEQRNKYENRATNSIQLMLGGLLKVEPEDIKLKFIIGGC